MSPGQGVQLAGDKMRMRSGEDGVYGILAGGPMPSASGIPRMEREGFTGPSGGSASNSPGVHRRESMMEVSPVESHDGDISRGQRMR
jgi:hypothetical protein